MTTAGVLRKAAMKGKQYIWSFSDHRFVVNFRPQFFSRPLKFYGRFLTAGRPLGGSCEDFSNARPNPLPGGSRPCPKPSSLAPVWRPVWPSVLSPCLTHGNHSVLLLLNSFLILTQMRSQTTQTICSTSLLLEHEFANIHD